MIGPPNVTERLHNSKNRLTDWVWGLPPADEPGGRRFLRSFLRVICIFSREFDRDRIPLRASALTFTVVLSLVPVLALGTAVLKGLGAGDQMRQAAYRFIEQLEEPISLPTTVAEKQPEDVPLTVPSPKEDGTLTAHLRKAVDQIFDYVDHTDFAALGAFGILGLLIAAISVLSSIEQAMNTIWQAGSNRPWSRKIIDYMALMILLPITVNLALATEATLQSPTLLGHLQTFIPVLWLGKFFLKILPLLAVIATFSILYRFLPNIKVAMPPALAGGIFGGLSWVLVQIIYVKLQIGVARYNAIYGSFATLPLFLLWIYTAWVIFLSGAEIAFAVQVRRNYQWRDLLIAPIARLALAFEIMSEMLDDFRHGRVTEHAELTSRLRKPKTALATVLNDLEKAGKIHRVTDRDHCYVPAAPEEELKPAEFVDLIFGPVDRDLEKCPLASAALNGARAALADRNFSRPRKK